MKMGKYIAIGLLLGILGSSCSLFQTKETPKPIVEQDLATAGTKDVPPEKQIEEENPVDVIAGLLRSFTNIESDDAFTIENEAEKQSFNKALKYVGQSIVNGKKIKWILKIKPNAKEKRFSYEFQLENLKRKDKTITLKDRLTIVHDDPNELIKIIDNILREI